MIRIQVGHCYQEIVTMESVPSAFSALRTTFPSCGSSTPSDLSPDRATDSIRSISPSMSFLLASDFLSLSSCFSFFAATTAFSRFFFKRCCFRFLKPVMNSLRIWVRPFPLGYYLLSALLNSTVTASFSLFLLILDVKKSAKPCRKHVAKLLPAQGAEMRRYSG